MHSEKLSDFDSGRAERFVFLNKADQPGRRAVAKQITHLLKEKPPSSLQRILIG
ncbi:MAG: hypothetical protein HQ517_07240 [SAR324 cluster bacterium]|nr:hypothetical protein [SAR324 cluster bacterium]